MTEPGLPDEDALVDHAGLIVPSAPRNVALVRRYTVDACAALGWGDSADTVARWTGAPSPLSGMDRDRGAEDRMALAEAGAAERRDAAADHPWSRAAARSASDLSPRASAASSRTSAARSRSSAA